MDIFGVLSPIGGLALFLYGMHVMGAGLEKMSRKAGAHPGESDIESVKSGTARCRRHSGHTVIFRDNGYGCRICKFRYYEASQAIGIIMGANIGTTITAWLLSLTGNSGTTFINMLKPTSFSPILAMIGIILLMSGKSDKKKITGEILLDSSC